MMNCLEQLEKYIRISCLIEIYSSMALDDGSEKNSLLHNYEWRGNQISVIFLFLSI